MDPALGRNVSIFRDFEAPVIRRAVGQGMKKSRCQANGHLKIFEKKSRRYDLHEDTQRRLAKTVGQNISLFEFYSLN